MYYSFILFKGNLCERRFTYMNNSDLIWRLVELILKKENDLNQVALDQAKNDSNPNGQEHNEA